MLIAHVERYLSLRQMLGYKLRNTSGNLRAFARFAAGRGDTHVRWYLEATPELMTDIAAAAEALIGREGL
jgi:hypothetical protein